MLHRSRGGLQAVSGSFDGEGSFRLRERSSRDEVAVAVEPAEDTDLYYEKKKGNRFKKVQPLGAIYQVKKRYFLKELHLLKKLYLLKELQPLPSLNKRCVQLMFLSVKLEMKGFEAQYGQWTLAQGTRKRDN